MAKADHIFKPKGNYIEVPCNHHPETCNCGGSRIKKVVKNKNK